MPRKSKPRKSAFKIQENPKVEFKSVEISDPKKLPEHYLVVADGWTGRVEFWDVRLRERGRVIKRPLTLYKLTRKVGGLELCLEVEELTETPPNTVVTRRQYPDKKYPRATA